ncbi:MAG: prolyl oligopeptidase family serine peptidase [Acidobacteriota bacterium]|jgi:alpha-L-fucosidase 2
MRKVCSANDGKSPYVTCPVEQFRVISTQSAAILLLPGKSELLSFIGYSAGGHLVCQVAVLAKEDTRVQAVVGLAPPTDHEADSERRGGLSPSLRNLLEHPVTLDGAAREILREISPVNHIKPGLPPFLLVHGTEDKSVPFQQSLSFQARLKAAGGTCEPISIPGAPHRMSDWEKFDTGYAARIAAWLKQTLR